MMHGVWYIVVVASCGIYLRPPVLGSTGFKGHKAAPIVLPSSLRRLYVEAALRFVVSAMTYRHLSQTHRVHDVKLNA
jgi:hypothetical protein